MTDLKLFDPEENAPPAPIGRVYKDDIECVVLADGTWTSDQRPDMAEVFTRAGYASDLDSASGKNIRSVLEKVSEIWPGSKWECYTPMATKDLIY